MSIIFLRENPNFGIDENGDLHMRFGVRGRWKKIEMTTEEEWAKFPWYKKAWGFFCLAMVLAVAK